MNRFTECRNALGREMAMSGQLDHWGNPTLVGLMNQMTVAIMRANSAPRALWQNFPKVPVQHYRFYTFYSFDKDERIILGEDRECESDAMAIAYGREMLAFSGYQKIEVWLRNGRVALVQKSVADDQSPASVDTGTQTR
jgi:hypothetical protein